jgi:5'(3')-deoxyribonucleotidase
MKIYFDMDDVGNELNRYLLGIYNNEYGGNFNFRDSESPLVNENYDIKVDDSYFKNIIYQEGCFLNLEPLEGYINLIKHLMDENYDVRILTYPQWTSPYCMNEKIEWIRRHLPFFNLDNIIFTRLKEELASENRILIDDNPNYLKKWEEHGGIGIAFGTSKYTKKWNGYRANDFDEIYNIIKKIEEEKHAHTC